MWLCSFSDGRDRRTVKPEDGSSSFKRELVYLPLDVRLRTQLKQATDEPKADSAAAGLGGGYYKELPQDRERF